MDGPSVHRHFANRAPLFGAILGRERAEGKQQTALLAGPLCRPLKGAETNEGTENTEADGL